MITLDAYLQQHYTTGTASVYRFEIDAYLLNYPGAARAVYKDVLQYLGLLRQRYSKASTLNRILCSIKVYYDFLCYTGLRSDNPARGIRLRDPRQRDIQLQDLLSWEELERLIDREERYTLLGCRNQVLMGLLIYQALPPVSLAALRVEDIQLQHGKVYIRATATTNQRVLPLKAAQVLLLQEYLSRVRQQLLCGSSATALLVGLRGAPMQAADITKQLQRKYRGVYGSRIVTAQTIRQSVIAHLLKQGHDLSMVQVFAGHKYPSSTQQYQQQGIDVLRSVISQYHPVQ